jgi:DNA repair protein RadC
LAKNIKYLPPDDRPYERLELMGESNLTNSELLAIIIKTGTKKYNCLEIAQNILNDKLSNMSDLEFLSNLSLEELKSYEGIGKIKAIQIKAVIELSKRLSSTYISDKKKITSPNDVFKLLQREFIGKKQEVLKTVILNKNNCVISVITNAIGSTDNINVGIKEILSEPIKQMASSIILAHNHPSGNLTPSKADISFTKKINEYAKIFDIQILDHLIISNIGYVSLKEKRII